MMQKSLIIYNMHSTNSVPKLERWLYKDHAPDTLSAFGPIMTQYDTYRSIYVPTDMRHLFKKYGTYNWRIINQWWMDTPVDKNGNLCRAASLACNKTPEIDQMLDIQPGGVAVKEWAGNEEVHPPVCVFLPLRHTEDFKGADKNLYDFKCITRWVMAFKYPEGVSIEEGEDWYLNVFAPEVAKLDGVARFISYKVSETPSASPFHRVSEIWFEDLHAWKDMVQDNPPAFTKPAWASYPEFPFLKPYEDFVGIFVDERPECSFMTELGPYTFTS